jgi:hypothetical protein
MIRLFQILFSLFFLLGCSSSNSIKGAGSISQYSKKYNLQDKGGDYLVNRESGMDKKSGNYFTKYRIYKKGKGDGEILEQSVVFSTPGLLKGKLKALRPYRSQFQIWFEKKKYQSETSLNRQSKSMDLILKSPEAQWNGFKKENFPKSKNGVFCYFSQVIECAQFTGFIEKAIKKDMGEMNFIIVWDGYPYIQEQYVNLPGTLFSQASLIYDGKNTYGEVRFSLNVAGNKIFYFLDNKYHLSKIFWPGQGMSMVEIK